MKKVVSLLLCALMLVGALASCTTLEEGTDGMIIDVYMTTELYDFDPARNFNDDAMVKILDLIYEGLTDLDEDGKWKKALIKDYTFSGSDGKGYSLLITLNATKWTDGRTVQAQDFVYAWKRILDPDFKCEAASLLYDIRNAYEVKMGDMSIDDLGVAAVDTYVLRIDFDYKIDLDAFMTTLASPALVPLREDIVTRDVNWGTQSSTLVTNGPFAIKELTKGEILRLDRSGYYYLDTTKEDEPQDKYVIPYRLATNYSYGDASAQLAKFEAGELFYVGEIPLSSRAAYANEATVTDEMSTHTYFFNTNNALFSDARVRRALSMALDREEIVRIVTFAKAATGLIPGKVFDATAKKEFRQVGGNLISTTADVAGAQALLNEAGVKSGAFTITIRPNEVDRAVAEYVRGVWSSLGFTVTVEEAQAQKIAGYEKAYEDVFATKYTNGDFDVIAVDYQMLSPYAFGALASFAASFSGNGVDMNSETYDLFGHVSGYNSEAYNALIASAYEAKDAAARTELLHQAETMLMEDMPVVPLFFMQDAYLIHDDLSGYGTSYFASREFKRMKLKDYVKYLPAEETEAAAE